MKNEKILGEILKKNNLTIGVAESFTGGLFAKRITDIPGSSEYFLGGVIAYSYKAKEKLLKVNKDLLSEKGAINADTAKQMAENIKNILNTNIGVSFTGNAGPTAQEGKPVGLVYVGISYNGNTRVFENLLKGNREEIRNSAVDLTIEKIINIIGGNI